MNEKERREGYCMKTLFKDLWLAVALIVAASSVLLLSDLGRRHGVDKGAGRNTYSQAGIPQGQDSITEIKLAVKFSKPVKIAMINLVENELLDEAQQGVVEALVRGGLKVDEDFAVKKYCAQGELGQMPQIIKAVVQANPDVIVTITTPAMIAVVKEVKDIPVVFCVASDPFKIGLFKDKRQPNVCGVHDDPAVDQLLDMAKKYNPGTDAAGIVFDPAQPNSVLSVVKLRKAGEDRNIKVIEATVSNVSELTLATQSLIQRGAKAIIVSADNVATTGFPAIYKAASASGVPVFATEPQLVEQGATGAIGNSYKDWGLQSGAMVAKILSGASPVDLPIEPTKVSTRIDSKNVTANTLKGHFYRLRLVQYSETEFAERCREGLLDGISRSGLVEEKDYEIKLYNAQGDMSTLSSIMTGIKSDNPDLLMVISTPTLQAALRQAGPDIKIVFTGVGDAITAGAGTSETDHLPNVTGITTRSPFDGMARLVKEMIPGVTAVGTLFTPAEINSVFYKDLLDQELKKTGISLVAVPVTSSADLAQAATDLCMKNIQAVCQIADNTTRQGFALVARKASDQGLPVFVFDSDEIPQGATVCLARDYFDAGLEAAEKAVRILRGESPSSIPFSNTQTEKLQYVPDKANAYHLVLSPAFLEKATIFTPTNK